MACGVWGGAWLLLAQLPSLRALAVGSVPHLLRSPPSPLLLSRPPPARNSPLLMASLEAFDVSASVLWIAEIAVDQGPEESQPVSALFEDGLAVAYLGVLTVLFGFLAFLALSDRRAKKQREESLIEMEAMSEELRRQGKEIEADVLVSEVKKIKAEPDPAASKQPQGMATTDELNNRFARRKQKERRKRRKRA